MGPEGVAPRCMYAAGTYFKFPDGLFWLCTTFCCKRHIYISPLASTSPKYFPRPPFCNTDISLKHDSFHGCGAAIVSAHARTVCSK